MAENKKIVEITWFEFNRLKKAAKVSNPDLAQIASKMGISLSADTLRTYQYRYKNQIVPPLIVKVLQKALGTEIMNYYLEQLRENSQTFAEKYLNLIFINISDIRAKMEQRKPKKRKNASEQKADN